jgi:RNA polymerase sigma-70 factor (ECF subfamily)
MPHWNAIVREHGPMVFRVAWAILGDADEAEDVGQEVFLELWRLLQSREIENFGGLLRRMATLRALDRLRRLKRSVPLDDEAALATDRGPEADAIGKERAEILRAAIARLPERMAAVFCLRYGEHLSNREIAEVLKISPSAVSTALHKARSRLESLLSSSIRGDL